MLLDEIEAFVHVVEAGSFTAAAKKLGVPKSTLSRAISRLEDATRVRLLSRSTRTLGLTEPGERFFAQVGPHVGGLKDAMNLLGDIYLAMDDLAKAETAYSDAKRLYPAAGGASSVAEVGPALVAARKKDFATAKAKIEPIVAEALGEKSPPPAKAMAYSKAFLVSAQVKEAEGNLSGALEDYLRTVTIFYHDPAAVSVAQEQADKLRARSKENPITVP